MTCGLLQLSMYGSQDIYLTSNPQITFFKLVYRRHTNFSLETREYPLLGDTSFGGLATLKFSKDGDLINKVYLRITLDKVDPETSKFAWTRRLGHAILDNISITIGGSVIDRQTGVWLDVWYELSHKNNLETGYDNLIGDVPEMTEYNSKNKPEYTLYIPLSFWFNNFIGLSVPVIALQYYDLILNVTFSKINNIIIRDNCFDILKPTIKSATVLADYIYLDTQERSRFAQLSHEYLITQVQTNGPNLINSVMSKYKLGFNFPCKEIIWILKQKKYNLSMPFIYYTDKWTCHALINASKTLLLSSISDADPTDVTGGCWYKISSKTHTHILNLNIANLSCHDFWINPTSLAINKNNNLTSKITADIIINNICDINICNISTEITYEDISVPTSQMVEDTRYCPDDVLVNIFNNYGLFINNTGSSLSYAKITFNGMDRFSKREAAYLNTIQPYEHHTNIPKTNIFLYSFALQPEEHQPSSSANLSRVDTSELILWLNNLNSPTDLYIFAVNYNIFRIASGFGGLAY